MPAPAKANPRGRPKGRAVLSQQDWFNAATEAILEGGFDQLRVLPLAKRLKVTRGSFYWHFDDLGSFIHLFLDQWQALRMRGLRYWQPGKDPSLSPEQEVDRVLTLMFEGPAVEFKRMKVEFAIPWGKPANVLLQILRCRRQKSRPCRRALGRQRKRHR